MKRLDNYVKMIGGVATAEYTAVASAYATLIQEIELAFRNPAVVPVVAVVTPGGETIANALARAIPAQAAVAAAARPGAMNDAYSNALKDLAARALAVINAAEQAALQPAAPAAAANVLITNATDAAQGAVTAAAAAAVAAAAAAAAVAVAAGADGAGAAAAAAAAAPKSNQINLVAGIALATVLPATTAGSGEVAAGVNAIIVLAPGLAAAAAAAPAPPAAAAAAPTPQAVYYDSGPAEPTSFNVSVYRTKDGKDSFVGTRPAYPSTSVKTILDGLKQSGETVIVSSGEQFVKSLNGKETYSTLGNLRLKSESVKFFVL
jgi:hypothetical protein